MYQELREKLWWHGMPREIGSFIARCDICQRVKLSINVPPDCFNLCKYQNGNGMKSVWTLLPDYRGLAAEMTLSGLFVTGLPKWPTSFLSRPPIGEIS